MTNQGCFLPAARTKVRSLRLGRLSVRTAADGELGKLLGFLIDLPEQAITSLVVEVADRAGSQQFLLPMTAVRFDPESLALRLIDSTAPTLTAFRADLVSRIDEEDLWVPLFHSAA
jgi:hypothetical protein